MFRFVHTVRYSCEYHERYGSYRVYPEGFVPHRTLCVEGLRNEGRLSREERSEGVTRADLGG